MGGGGHIHHSNHQLDVSRCMGMCHVWPGVCVCVCVLGEGLRGGDTRSVTNMWNLGGSRSLSRKWKAQPRACSEDTGETHRLHIWVGNRGMADFSACHGSSAGGEGREKAYPASFTSKKAPATDGINGFALGCAWLKPVFPHVWLMSDLSALARLWTRPQYGTGTTRKTAHGVVHVRIKVSGSGGYTPFDSRNA